MSWILYTKFLCCRLANFLHDHLVSQLIRLIQALKTLGSLLEIEKIEIGIAPASKPQDQAFVLYADLRQFQTKIETEVHILKHDLTTAGSFLDEFGTQISRAQKQSEE